MYFILPDEGRAPRELLSDPQLTELLLHGATEDNYREEVEIFLHPPKFVVSSKTNLKRGLQSMGVSDVFDYRVAEFKLTDEEMPIYVSQAENASRISIEEQGCKTASYTEFSEAQRGIPFTEEITLTFDRPFIMAVVNELTGEIGTDNLPLFVGIIDSPAEE